MLFGKKDTIRNKNWRIEINIKNSDVYCNPPAQSQVKFSFETRV